MHKKTLWIALFALAVLAPTVADAGDWILRGRAINVEPNDSSDAIPLVGGEIGVDSDTTLEVDFTYMFNENWGLEVIAAVPSHDVFVDGGTANELAIGKADLLPPCFTAQYFFGEDKLRPYLGFGLNFTFFSFDMSDDFAVATGATDVELDDALGYLVSGGMDWYLGKGNFLLNFDIKYVLLSTDATIVGGVLGGAKIGVDIDPWIIGLGVGYKF